VEGGGAQAGNGRVLTPLFNAAPPAARTRTRHPAAGTRGVSDTDLRVADLPPWQLWPARERTLSALAEARDDLAVRLCRWPLSLADLSARSGVPRQTLSRLRLAAAQTWPVYKRLDDLTDAGATIRAARRYARLRADLRVLNARAAAEAQRLRAAGHGWKRINAALGAPPGADTGWVRVLLKRRERSAGRIGSPAGTEDERPPSGRKGALP
jgi:lambda repressor-like predicted transcriptional regulator